MKKIVSIVSCFAAILLLGCDKNELPVPVSFDIPAKLKVNYASAYAANPLVQLKVNGERVSEAFKYAYPYPGGGLNTQGGSQPDYFAVPLGDVKMSLSLPKAGTNADSVELYTTTTKITSNDYFTLHVADTGANTKSILLKENTAAPDSGFSTYRFVNLIPDVPALDLYFANVLVAANIPYLGASASFNIAFPTASSWAVRPAGAAANSTALASYNNTTPNQRVFTVFARGYKGATDANRKATVSLYYVR